MEEDKREEAFKKLAQLLAEDKDFWTVKPDFGNKYDLFARKDKTL